ncbi:MAG TPA: glycosyltransferase [Allosphingosinicella sp.]|jgi:glycosyltransferase involved in cell wall biosynthesis|nr:glycosyltransferase [Allosphingosinicella sp.]
MRPDRPPRTDDGSRLKVLLLLSWLNGGGAERVAVHLMNRSDSTRFDMRMGLLRRAGPYLPLVDPARVYHRDWSETYFPAEGTDRSFYAPHRLAMSAMVAPLVYRSIIREVRPDVVMSFAKGTNLVAGLSMAGMGAGRPAWIAREGNNALRAIADEASGPFGARVATALTRRCYRAADCVLVNAREMVGNLHATLDVPADQLRVIHNPIDLEGVRALAAEPLPDPPKRPFVVAVGRLERQKGHDILLRAFAASEAAAGHELVIAGQGQREAELRGLAAELGLADRVRFLPFADNPWAWVARAKLFVFPSRWEGFPNALGEALACGTAALAADCDFGPRELIRHDVSGWLVPPEDVGALAAGLDRLLPDEALRARLGAGGRERAEALRLENILPAYAGLFEEQAAYRRRALARAGAGVDSEPGAPAFEGVD